jgi:hypothetical protein
VDGISENHGRGTLPRLGAPAPAPAKTPHFEGDSRRSSPSRKVEYGATSSENGNGNGNTEWRRQSLRPFAPRGVAPRVRVEKSPVSSRDLYEIAERSGGWGERERAKTRQKMRRRRGPRARQKP